MSRALFALLLLFAGTADAAAVYKCRDAGGRIEYSDKPCAGAASERLDIDSAPTDAGAVKERIEERKETIEALDDAAATETEREEQARKDREAREAQCAAARERLEKMQQERLMFREKDGTREYLSSEEIIQRRQEQQDKVNALCGG